MSHKQRNYSVGITVPFEVMNHKWYLMVLGQYMTILGQYKLVLVLGGTGSAKGLYACILNTLEKVEIWSGMLPMPHFLTHTQTTDYSATQLV